MVKSLDLKSLKIVQSEMSRYWRDYSVQDNDFLALEQLRSFKLLSLVGLFAALPFLFLRLVETILAASALVVFINLVLIALFGLVIYANTQREYDVSSIEKVEKLFDLAKRDALFVSLLVPALTAIPLLSPAMYVGPGAILCALAVTVSSGFAFGSIPGALSMYLRLGGGLTFLVLCVGATLDMIFALAAYSLAVGFTGWVYQLFYYNFAKRLIHAEERSEAAETVRFLLNDYEEHSADWLWEVDEGFNIVNPSKQFLARVGVTETKLDGLPLLTLFSDSVERHHLKNCLENGQDFHKLILTRQVDGEEHFWQLSGRPVQEHSDAPPRFRGVASDITQTKRAEARVAHLAHFDSLTDLANRSLFNETLQRSLVRMNEDERFAVLYLDVDNFKTINDTMGHMAGDAMLKAIGKRLEKSADGVDLVARLGGDEFAVILRSTNDVENAKERAKALIETCRKPTMVMGQPINASLSIGLAMAPDHGTDIEQLIASADIALYHAKENGRDQVSVFEEPMRAAVKAKRMIETDLRKALIEGGLEVHYQPQVNIDSGKTTGYEALLRWTHAEQGAISPATFIPIAEETGLIVPLGEWVIRTAIAEAASWSDELPISINLSPVQLRSPRLLSTVTNALARYGLSPERLEFEITETVLMDESPANMQVLHKLRELGICIALDDFGTGYSSLNYLRSFPFDKIKIDRCFVEDINKNPDCQAIIRAVSSLADSLGMVTIAEGVESPDQIDQLRNGGCNHVQGFYYSAAIPADQLPGAKKPVIFEAKTSDVALLEAGKADVTDSAVQAYRKAG